MPRRAAGPAKMRTPTAKQVAVEMARLSLGRASRVVPKGTAKKYAGHAGARVGAAFGSRSIGRYVGRRVGAQFARITGVGDYHVQSDGSLMSPATAYAPQMASRGRDVIIERSEYVADLYSGAIYNDASTPSPFSTQQFAVNAGLDTVDGGVFTWLPQVAQGFQQYQLLSCVLEYRPTSGSATGSDTSLGTVMIAADYNPANPTAFHSKGDMLNSQWAMSAAPDKCILFPVECAARDEAIKWHDIRTGPPKSTENLNLTDLCTLTVATVGCQTLNQNLGELHVVYRVALTKFRNNPMTNTIRTAHYRSTSYTNAAPLGSTSGEVIPYPGNNYVLTFDSTRTLIGFPNPIPNGHFMLQIVWKGAATANCAIIADPSTDGLAFLETVFEAATGGATPLAELKTGTGSTAVWSWKGHMKFTGAKPDGYMGENVPYMVFGTATLPTSGSDVDIIFTEIGGPATPDA